MSLGDESDAITEGMAELTQLLHNNAPADFRWIYLHMEKESHGTTPHRTIYNGLEALFEGWQMPNDYYDSSFTYIEDHYQGLSAKYGFKICVPENTLNSIGYQALGNNDFDKAIEMFKLAVESYPKSANVYDSLGEGYEAKGELELAKKNYKIALEKGTKSNDPNLSYFKIHLENINKQLNK